MGLCLFPDDDDLDGPHAYFSYGSFAEFRRRLAHAEGFDLDGMLGSSEETGRGQRSQPESSRSSIIQTITAKTCLPWNVPLFCPGWRPSSCSGSRSLSE